MRIGAADLVAQCTRLEAELTRNCQSLLNSCHNSSVLDIAFNFTSMFLVMCYMHHSEVDIEKIEEITIIKKIPRLVTKIELLT